MKRISRSEFFGLLAVSTVVTWANVCSTPASAEPGPTMWVADLNAAAIEVPAAFAAEAGIVVACESRWRADAVNPASGARGLFQIMEIHTKRIQRLGYTWADMLSGGPNTLVAIDIWSEQGWSPWRASSACSGVQ